MGISGAKYSKDGFGQALAEKLTQQELVRHRIVPTHTYGIHQNSNKHPAFTKEAVLEYQLKVDPVSSTCKQEVEMAAEALKRDFGVPEREVTARIVLRLRPVMETEASDDDTDEFTARARERERPWTTIDYCFNRVNGAESLDVRGKGGLDSLLPDHARGLIGQGLFSNDTAVNIFFNFLDYFINNMEGKVWWNGFTMNLSGDQNTSFELIDLEMDPLRLIYKVKGLREIDIIRSVKRFELIGKSMRLGEEPKTLQISGPKVSMIKTMAPKDGTILLNFPTYNSNPNMD